MPVTVTGTVTFNLVRDPGGRTATVDGTWSGTVELIVMSPLVFNGKMQGSVDCATGKITTGKIDGNFAVVVGFSGGYDGTFEKGAVTGTWNEHETASPNYKGSGTWDAHTGP